MHWRKSERRVSRLKNQLVPLPSVGLPGHLDTWHIRSQTRQNDHSPELFPMSRLDIPVQGGGVHGGTLAQISQELIGDSTGNPFQP